MISLFASCATRDNNEITMKDIRIFQNTSAWDLAQAVETERISEIEIVANKNPELLNYRDPIFGTTLLMWSVSMEKYRAALALLEAGADPNIRSNSGATALFKAISYSWIDTKAKQESRYVELLLKYGADPDLVYIGKKKEGVTDPIEKGTSPLMHAVSRSFAKTRALVEAGANINYKTQTNQSAATTALIMEKLDVAYYLIVEKKASVSEPFYFYEIGSDSINYKKKYYATDLLRNWIYELDSYEYRKKMAIVAELKRQGLDYRSTNIPESTLERIKILHPKNWEEYLERY